MHHLDLFHLQLVRKNLQRTLELLKIDPDFDTMVPILNIKFAISDLDQIIRTNTPVEAA